MRQGELAPYMTWAKLRPPPRYDLAGSNLLACPLEELPGLDSLEPGGANSEGWAPLVERIASRYGVMPAQVATGGLAIRRAFETSARERMTREWILQLKTGHVDARAFAAKHSVDALREFAPVLERLAEQELLDVHDGRVELRPAGLLRVDQLLPEFYADAYRGARYT